MSNSENSSTIEMGLYFLWGRLYGSIFVRFQVGNLLFEPTCASDTGTISNFSCHSMSPKEQYMSMIHVNQRRRGHSLSILFMSYKRNNKMIDDKDATLPLQCLHVTSC